MSLHAWEYADDQASVGPVSSTVHFYQSLGECEGEGSLKDDASAQESDSEHLYSSVGSSDRLASSFAADIPQVVPCKFIISLAVPTFTPAHKGKPTSLMDKFKQRPKVDRSLAKNRRFYHTEYFLLPDDAEPKKADLVVFPTVAKVFLDSGVKTVKPWQEGDKVWVSWTQTFHIHMTKELLKKINFYKITLRLWDTKDRVPRRVRYYRLKASGYSEDTGSSEEVRNLVLSQRKLPKQETHVPGKRTQEHVPGKPGRADHAKHLPEPDSSLKGLENDEKLFRMEDPGWFQWSISRKMNSLAGVTEMKEINTGSSVSSLTNMSEKQKFSIRQKESEGKRKIQKKSKSVTEEDLNSGLMNHWKPETFSMQLAVMPLLAGWQTVVSHGSLKSADILDCFLTLKTDVPIMTEEQKQDLNPLTIKIRSISGLPSQPVPICELERLCTPVYCRYQFQKTPVHRTEGRPHGTKVYFQDINVIFLGAMHPRDLREYLEGPPMVVEVHDRDGKWEECSQKPTLFGEDPFDAHFNRHPLATPREWESSPLDAQDSAWDPYGVARVSFAELLLGHKYLNLVVPIHGCEPSPANLSLDRRSRKVAGFQAPPGGLQHSTLPAGSYLEAGTQLKLRVDVAVPLQACAETPELEPRATEFGRVVFVFHGKRPPLLRGLLRDAAAVNARALGLDSHPLRNIQQILSAFRMHVRVQERPELDVLTGFHLLDGTLHLLLLEGLAEQGLARLWDSHQRRATRLKQAQCPDADGPGTHKVLYNSRLLFCQRLYADLETLLYRVHLCQPLSLLLRQPELYLRKAVPRPAFQALTRIYCICRHSARLREVVARDLLPSSTMIKVLNQEFGLPISPRELMDRKPVQPPKPVPGPEPPRAHTSDLSLAISAHRERYLQWRSAMMLKSKSQIQSLIQQNIAGVYQASRKPPKPVVRVIRISAPAGDAVYNYSIQTLNSTELAKKQLYKQMAKEPRKRFTYSQNYLSAMVEPRDPEEEERKAREQARQAWLTPSGFQVTGLQGGQSDSHLRLLPPGFLQDERREEAPAGNLPQPVLDRERWSWDRRHQDFELYKRPPPFLALPPAPKPAPGRMPKGSRPAS